jgi:fatty acid oxidation complex beta subunit FadI
MHALKNISTFDVNNRTMNEKIVFIDGCRTPFLKSGTDYFKHDIMSYQLGQYAIKGLLVRTGLDPKLVDTVIMGTVISNIQTSNVAREAALGAGLPMSTPCHTVTQACISANQAVAAGIGAIRSGQAEIFIAGGVDNTSDTPIGFKKEMRKKLFAAQKLKTFGDNLKFVFSLRPRHFAPERPKVAEFTTQRTMGQDCDILAAKYGVTREEQDEFCLRSHTLADQAWKDGHLGKEVVEVAFPPKFKPVNYDNGIRVSSLEKLAKLRPAFDKKHGTLTAANSSFLTDGGSAGLFMTESKAKELGLTPKAEIVDFCFTGQELDEELLLGPTFATSKVLQKTGLTLEDMDVIEFHEAFAGQIMANLKTLASDDFAKTKLGRDKAVGKVNMDKLNLWGGSLAIGHPFGATGVRLITTAANRLQHEGGKYAILAACAAGAHGHAMIIKKYEA